MSFERLSEQLAIVGTIDPVAATATGTAATDIFNMENHHEVMFVLMFNTVTPNGATIDFAVQEGTGTTAGTFNTVTAVAAAVQGTGANADDDQWVVTVRGEDMTPGYSYLRGFVTLGGTVTTVEYSVVALADRARYKPANVGDLASVTQIVDA
jgi:hypothetical protein